MAEKDKNRTEGGISVEAEHIFPVIKKWLYSEKDIFIREIVSNACDAITKLKRLISLGEAEDDGTDYRIDVVLNKDKGTLTVSDNGIGMDPEEIRKYICNIALSGAVDFISKYEDSEAGNGIIGHFGLGFYSAFMVCDKVTVISRSYKDGQATSWEGNEDGSYVITDGAERETHGTDVIMYISDEEKEFLDAGRIKSVLDKYCAFMNVPIYFDDGEKKDNKEKEDKEEGKEETGEKPINETNPLWLRNPSDCKDEDYTEFYRKVFGDYREPVFYIHINADYPLNFRGVLYFPRLNMRTDNLEGQIKLYYNQVFVSDNVKDILPEYMLMLRGVIDCPELPLNVSRSYMQNDVYVKKMAAHITKKVCDKINSLAANREEYEKIWKEIKLFTEYSSLRDKKFYDKVKGSVLFEKTGGGYCTLDEYLSGAEKTHKDVVYYVNDKVSGAQYIELYESEGIDVLLLDNSIDPQFISFVEQDRNIKFKRVDSDLASALTEEGGETENEKLTALFKEAGGESLTVKYEKFKNAEIPAILNINEENRRFSDMMKVFSMGDAPAMPAPEATLIVNTANPLIEKLGKEPDPDIVSQIYSLALLSQRGFTAEELNKFLKESYSILERAADKEEE